MNWLIKFSKKIILLFIGIFVFAVLCQADVITGGIRQEYNQNSENQKTEIPEIEPEFSTGSVLAYNAGVQYYNNQDYDKAINYFLNAVDQEPRFGDAYFNLGLLYYHFEKPSNAIVAFYRAYLSNKKDYEALFYMVKCYADKGDMVAARHYAKKIPSKSEFYSKTQEVLK